MWTVLQFDKKKFHFLKRDLTQKLGKGLILYNPKIKIQKYKKNKLKDIEFNILGNYIFCFHKNFNKENIFYNLKFCRGLKYFLNGCIESQLEIKKFVEKCKSLEDNEGYISKTLFQLNVNGSYEFSSGPFAKKIFKIINLQKNKIDILMGNVKTTINKQNFLFTPV